MKVLITRAKPQATQTSQNLDRSGHEAICLPLSEIIDLGTAIPELQYDGIIFTSKNAVDILKNRSWTPKNFNIPTYCVGEKTQQAAKAYGFNTTHTAYGGGKALTKLINEMNINKGRLLYPSTPEKNFDMSQALKSEDLHIDTIDIYRANPLTPPRKESQKALKKVMKDYIFVYSALSGKNLMEILNTENLTNSLQDCTLIGISKQAIQFLEHIEWKEVLIADEPNEEQMITLIDLP